MANFTQTGLPAIDNSIIRDVIEDLVSKQDRLRPLTFLNRTPVTPAENDELFAVWSANLYMADIVADDQKAPIVEAGQLEVFVTSVPNIKQGGRLTQDLINRLRKAQKEGTEQDLYRFWFDVIGKRVEGVRQRQNHLIGQALLGTVTYDRQGIKVTQDYNVPADLKVTVSPLWTDAANAKPITNILDVRNVGERKYGKVYDRVTISYNDLTLMVATTEFQNKATGVFGNFAATTAMLNLSDRRMMKDFVGRLLDMTVEIEDGFGRTQETDASATVHRYLADGKVLLTSTADDNDADVIDLANAEVTEAMVAEILGTSSPVDLAGQRFGPVGYWAPTNVNLDPPQLSAFAVARSFPRRKQKEAAASLTVR
jgi:hypothetical protein